MNDHYAHLRPDGTRKPPRREPAPQPDLFDWGRTAAETKSAAYRKSRPKANARHEMILRFVAECGVRGATREEIANSTGLRLQSVCSPVLTLLQEGRLREDGRKRPTSSGSAAAVCVVTGGNHG